MNVYIELLRIVVDFGLMVLIWMVQLLIYPGFEFLAASTFHKWHRKYARNMTYIVAPMMFVQVFLAGYFIIYTPGLQLWNISYAILVALTWISTFLIFIPLHKKLDDEPHNVEVCRKLTKRNWLRIVLWTAIVILDLYIFI